MVQEKEKETRKKRIDPMLQAAGWAIVTYEAGQPLIGYERCAIEEFPTDDGPADYVLCVDGAILGIVEAKKLTLGPQNVLTQAERYSRGARASTLYFQGYRVPFLYSTNGEVVWHDDVRHPAHRSRKISGFHTPEALVERMRATFEACCADLLSTPNNNPRLRPYQVEATSAIEQAISNRKRQMLVAMATGTGKTLTMVNEVYRLMKAGVARRVLFLVDRRPLAAQAVQQFASFEAEPNKKFDQIYEVYSQRFHRDDFDESEKFEPQLVPTSYLTKPRPGLAFVYVSTIQRMVINLFGRDAVFHPGDEPIDEDARKLDIPIHAFDLVIADECHRGYTVRDTAIWRKTLDYFDAIKIGLTATPAAHTAAYFNDMVFRYPFERAIREGFLVDYDPVAIQSGARLNGIFLKQGEEVGLVDPVTGAEKMDQLEDERQFDAANVEEKVTSPDSNRKIIEEVKKYALKHEEEYRRFPKTLIFAVNDLAHTSHADQLVNLARDVFGRGDLFVQKITGTVDRPLQRIREFRNRLQTGVVVTVDMLSTGVDIPDLEFIVFLRPIKSRILFEQMLGRGTRLGENLTDKSHFVLFDCFDGTLLKYFRNSTGITAEPPQPGTRGILEIIEDIWQNRDRDYNTGCLVKRLLRIDKEMAGEARGRFADYIDAGDIAKFARELPRKLRDDFTGTISLLRDAAFQDLLVNYPRKQRTFLVAVEHQDTVTSRVLIRDGRGIEYKPEDYLAAFARFVRDNRDSIDAITILLDRPGDWNVAALSQLRQKLAAEPERYTLENLQKAHELRYNKALVDIISMIKHAAGQHEPLFTAEERVNLAVLKVTAGRTLTDEQKRWLDRIREHLVQNLSLDKEDFDDVPVLARAGGWGKADRDFANQLDNLIQEFNEAIAA